MTDWKKLQEFQQENRKLLVMIADPMDDSISISFGGFGTFVKFPFVKMEDGVVFNVLRKSKFNAAIDAFMAGIISAMGVDEKEIATANALNVLGGSIKSIGEERDIQKRSELQTINTGDNAKAKKSRSRAKK